MSNVWQDEAHSRVNEFTASRYERRIEHALTDFEYQGADDYQRPCYKLCLGTLQYKATIGALKCNYCGALARVNGDRIVSSR